MTETSYTGSGDIPYEIGTVIRLRCPMARFEQLKPASKRAKADFRQLVGYLAEELRYTYAPLIASEQLILSILCCDQSGHEELIELTPLEPEWDGDPIELPESKVDLGGGPVSIRCRYGLINKSKNAMYYKGNMASSGFEIRLNGRCVAHGLLSEVFGKATHPSGNRFLAQVDLTSTDGAALPPTETTKNALVEADLRTQGALRFSPRKCRVAQADPQHAREAAGRPARRKEARRSRRPARLARGTHLPSGGLKAAHRSARRPRGRR